MGAAESQLVCDSVSCSRREEVRLIRQDMPRNVVSNLGVRAFRRHVAERLLEIVRSQTREAAMTSTTPTALQVPNKDLMIVNSCELHESSSLTLSLSLSQSQSQSQTTLG